ncbi:MAG: helix-turn-helix domain-containing protein, partial [Planctomycetaceae bacterium]
MQNFKQIVLSDEEKQCLNSQLTNPRTAPRQKLRALIILELASGLSNLQTAAKLGCSRRTVGIWRQRFLQERLPALTPRNHRAGR